jgi:hypothetical protein
MSWDRNNCGNLLESLIILICLLIFFVDQFQYFHELKYQDLGTDNESKQGDVNYTIVFNLMKRNNVTLIFALSFLLFRVS